MKRILLTIMIAMVMISLVGATQDSLGVYAQNEDIELLQICGTCTYNNITSIVYPNSTHQIIDTEMTKRGMEYTYTFNQTNLVGTYLINGFGDLDGVDTAWAYELRVGEVIETSNTLIYIFLMLFFLSLNLFYYKISEKIDFDKWYQKIVQKYQDKNKVKVTLSGIAYSFAKDTFIVHYLLVAPTLLLLMQIVNSYNLFTLIPILDVIIVLYAIGLAIVGFIFFGKLLEFIKRIMDDVEKTNWGISD